MIRVVIWVASRGMGFGPLGLAVAAGSLVLAGVGIGRKTKKGR